MIELTTVEKKIVAKIKNTTMRSTIEADFKEMLDESLGWFSNNRDFKQVLFNRMREICFKISEKEREVLNEQLLRHIVQKYHDCSVDAVDFGIDFLYYEIMDSVVFDESGNKRFEY